MKKNSINDLPRIERPREKLLRYGPDKLKSEELLAIILRTGTREYGVLKLSEKIFSYFKERSKNPAEAEVGELMGMFGMGPARACEIAALFELGKRFLLDKKTEIFLSPEDVWKAMRELRAAKKEHFVAFFLDTRNQVIKSEIISVGTLNYSVVHPREVFEPAVRTHANSVMISHNHPSGSLEPSDEDINITKRLERAGEILGIKLLDHVIVTNEGYISLREKKLM